jgi:hypothetical protein
MAAEPAQEGSAARGPRWKFLLGAAGAALLLLGTAEGYLRLFPPRDLQPYLGEDSPLTGCYVPDDCFGVAYRSWDVFRANYAERLREFLPWQSPTDPRPLWAFFGNSFVQSPGMLADHVRSAVIGRRIFNLGRNEWLFVRLAQIKLLLDQGMQPERLFVELMPVDVVLLGQQPLDTIQVTAKGALTYRPHQPDGLVGWLVRHSQMALTAWIRSGQHQGNPTFNWRTLCRRIDQRLLDDLDRLFGNLARVTRQHQVPVTILLLPTFHQIVYGESLGFQDTLAVMLRRQGYDVFDPRDVFCHHADPSSLFLPDKHFNARGNQLLLESLLNHLGSPPPSPDAGPRGGAS